MSKNDKLIKKLKSMPKDFTYEEAKKVLSYYGFEEDSKGKTSGSRVIFFRQRDNRKLMLHKPHPGNELKKYAIKNLKDFIEELGEDDE